MAAAADEFPNLEFVIQPDESARSSSEHCVRSQPKAQNATS
jgi:hypothetical protein